MPETIQQLITARSTPSNPRTRPCCRTSPCSARPAGSSRWSRSPAWPERVRRRAAPAGAARAAAPHPRRRSAGEHEYAFRHALMRDVAYGQLCAASAPSGTAVAGVARTLAADGVADRPSCSPTTTAGARPHQGARRAWSDRRGPAGWRSATRATGRRRWARWPPPRATTTRPWSCGPGTTPTGRICCCAWAGRG